MSFGAYLQARPAVNRVAAALVFVIVALGLSLGLSEITASASAKRADAKTELERYAADWQSRIGTRLSEAISLATAVGTFCAGNATYRLNHSQATPLEQRMQIVNPDVWNVTAAGLWAQVPGMLSIQTQPSGIIGQVYPPGSAPIGLDTLYLDITTVSMFQMARTGVPNVIGPITLVQGGIGVLASYPIYVADPVSLENWWGAGVVVFRVAELLNAMRIVPEFRRDGYEFVCYSRNLQNRSHPPEVVVATPALAGVGSVDVPDSYTVRFNTSDPYNALYMAFSPAGGLPSGVPEPVEIVAVVLPTLAGALAAAGALYLLTLIAFAVRHRRVPAGHATGKGKPAAMVLVSVKRMGWWTEVQEPAQLQADLIAFEREAGSLAEAHGCHLSGRLSEGCAFVVASTCEAAHSFALAANEQLPKKFEHLPIRKAGEAAVVRGDRSSYRRSVRQSQAGTASMQASRTSFPADRRRSTMKATSSHGRKSRANTDALQDSTHTSQTTKTRVSERSDKHATQGSFEFAVSLHFGALRSTYDADADRHTFFGSCIAAAALAVDTTQAGEVTASEAFAAAGDWSLVVRSTPARTLDDGESLFLVVGEVTTTDVSSSDNGGRRRRRADAGAAEGSVAAALSAKTGATVRKRVAVLALELLPDEAYTSKDRNGPVPNFTEALEQVLGEVSAMKGDLVSVQETRLLFAFNALHPVTAPAQRAANADAAVRAALGPKRRVVSTIALGFGFVAQAHGCVLLTGDAPFRARLLLDEVVALNAREHGVLQECAVVDGLTAEELKQAFELQCVGPCFGMAVAAASFAGIRIGVLADSQPAAKAQDVVAAMPIGDNNALVSQVTRGLKPSLAYVAERPWPDDDGAADDEWLYKLQRFEAMSPFTPLNAALEKAMAAGVIAAAEAQAVLLRPDAETFNPVAVAALQRFAGLEVNANACGGSSPGTGGVLTPHEAGGDAPIGFTADA